MAERKPIHIDNETDVVGLLRLVGETSLEVESAGVVYRIQRDDRDPLANYDPHQAIVSLRSSADALVTVDGDLLKREILEQREQHSQGRPE